MQNVHSTAFKVTWTPSRNILIINVKLDIFIEMLHNFIQAGECFYVMENVSKIKIVKLS